MSALTTSQNIINIVQKYTLSVYVIILIGGVIGNICNIIVFNVLKMFRRNQCAFYIITVSIFDAFLITIVLPFRVTKYVFNYDPTQLSLTWCKMRQLIVPALSLMSFSTICFAAIDQYLSTHHIPWLRRWSSLKLAHYLVYSAMIIWTLHGIPFLIFFKIQSTSGCTIYNAGFSIYFSFVHFCVLSGILPITVSTLSAILAYLNVRRLVRHQLSLVRRRLDRQLTAMILSKVAFLALTTSPFVIFRIYQMNRYISPNNLVQIAIEELIFILTTSLFYLNSAGTFYVFVIVSKRFRQQVKRVFVKIIWKKLLMIVRSNVVCHIHNQVAPTFESADLELE